jgi:hypothetical protein
MGEHERDVGQLSHVGHEMTAEDEKLLKRFADFLMTRTIVHVSEENADEWQRLFVRAMAILGQDATHYATAMIDEDALPW